VVKIVSRPVTADRDGEEFLALAPQVPVHTEVQTFRPSAANEALENLRAGRIQGAAVLINTDSSASRR
jgi:D-arabinose 1-dehydrogenase-like Zn-dependent alcohol dehydrogenase